LLESITDDNGKVQKKFEYDEQSRIVKVYEYDKDGKLYRTQTITYNADNSVTEETVYPDIRYTTIYVRKGNKITVEGETLLTVNEDGYIVKREGGGDSVSSYDYQYQDGNLIEDGIVWLESAYTDTYYYKYDDKKSPFSNSTTPKWLLVYSLSESKNNILESRFSSEGGSIDTKYKYEYDRDGFPTKRTAEGTHRGTYEDDPITYDTTITHFTYRGGK
jgi:hypothetical protein